ncbi:MAG TPA: PAS domain-containing protein [Thermoanaerobaculia bacterium]|jgi:PAS domain S-box-containing protein|nr:PAS domain-containing protein [Thermoanaerobaculia bacterium]
MTQPSGSIPGPRPPAAWLATWLSTAPGADHRPAAVRYGFALLAVAMAVAVRLPFHGLLHQAVPFLFFFPAIMASAWFGGLGPGLLATAVAAVLADFLYLSPAYTWSFTPLDLVQIALFLAVGSVISGLSQALHAARRRAEADRAERGRLTSALEQERRRLTNLVDSVPGVVWEAWGEPDAASQRIDFVSAYVETLLGYSVEEWLGTPNFWLTIVHPDDREEARRRAVATFAGGDGGPNHFRWKTRDGRALWVEAQAKVIRDDAGRPVGMRGVTIDVSGRRRAEQAAEESEERFHITADSAPVLIWMAGTDKLRDWFNRLWLEFTGRTMAQETGDGWAEGVHPDDRERYLGAYATAFDLREEFHMEYRLRRADGEYRWILANAVPRYTPEGTFAGFIGCCFDITERKAAEEEHGRLLARAEEARHEAEVANRTKDEFLATLSHELRTPLNAILGWAQMLRLRPGEPEIAERGLDIIARSVRSQTQLIEDLLDVSRITSGKMRLDVQPIELVPVVEAALESIRPAAEAKGIRLQRVFDPLGPVHGDPDRLQQVVWNLLANAVKFTPKGGRVQVLVTRVNSHVEIVVADSGVGITPEFLPHVFERFRQSDSSSRRQFGGLGLGLAIVRHLVELHGGTVEARSAGEGQGAVFTVCLPLAALPPALPERRHPKADLGDGRGLPGPGLAGIKVLVVEDDPDTRELILRVLADHAAEVTAVASAREGLAALESQRPDVLLSDIEMPGEDGYSLIAKVRALPRERGGATPAAALTAFARGEDRRRALQAGFQLHVAKPVEPAELATVVANLAGRTRPEPEPLPQPEPPPKPVPG